MLTSLHIEGFRQFRNYDLAGLGRLNLLVGTNNSGKTTILEAIDLLTSRGDPEVIWQSLSRRGERIRVKRDGRSELQADVGHLFYDHEPTLGSHFALSAENQEPGRYISFEIGEWSSSEQMQIELMQDSLTLPRLELKIKGNPTPLVTGIQLTDDGSIGIRSVQIDSPIRQRIRREANFPATPTQFITTQSLSGTELIRMWDQITLTPNENLVLAALRILDPKLYRISAQSSDTYGSSASQSRGNFVIIREGEDKRIPIGSMGDGMWRILAMVIAITQCKDGVLLVDEIDTGLHHTVMYDMWKVLYSASQLLNVQVFATTHSYDCVASLAKVCMENAGEEEQIALHRIENGNPASVAYTQQQLIAAADMGFEVR